MRVKTDVILSPPDFIFIFKLVVFSPNPQKTQVTTWEHLLDFTQLQWTQYFDVPNHMLLVQ